MARDSEAWLPAELGEAGAWPGAAQGPGGRRDRGRLGHAELGREEREGGRKAGRRWAEEGKKKNSRPR